MTASTQRKLVIIVPLLVIASMGVAIACFMVSFKAAVGEVTDGALYSEKVADLQHQGVFTDCPALQTLLPPSIPASASDVAFWYQPGFGQGGAELSIRYRLPPSELPAVEAALTHSPAIESRPSTDEGFCVGNRTNDKLARPERAFRTYGLRAGVTGAFAPKPNSVAGGIDFVCCIDPTRSEANYWVDIVK